MNDIEGKLALVTGASGGIGGACARQFAARNVHLALTYSSNRDKLAALVTELRASCPETLRISMHQVDLAYPEQIDSMFAEVQEAHKANVDILIVNAGYGKRIVNIWDIPLSEFDHTINVNLRASFLLARGVSRAMAEQRWGRIIFVSSIAAYGGGVNGCHYAASKGGLMGMMKNLATRLAPFNISVNDVAPAMVANTGMMAQANAQDIIDTIPLQRMCETDEVANAVLMLATTGFTTGQSILMSGGLK